MPRYAFQKHNGAERLKLLHDETSLVLEVDLDDEDTVQTLVEKYKAQNPVEPYVEVVCCHGTRRLRPTQRLREVPVLGGDLIYVEHWIAGAARRAAMFPASHQSEAAHKATHAAGLTGSTPLATHTPEMAEEWPFPPELQEEAVAPAVEINVGTPA